MIETKQDFFCSWSGGKDSCLSLYRALQEGHNLRLLLTMLIENGERSRSHGLPVSVIEKQASSLDVPLVVCPASWENYEEQFIHTIKNFRQQGIEVGVFGDIDLDGHKSWVERVCALVSIKPYHPLWKEPRRSLLMEFIELGFKAVVISVKDGVLDKSFLGRTLDERLILEFESLGIDASGEEGEFHTVVTDGPIFSFPVDLEFKGQVLHDGYWFQDVSILP